MDKFLIKWGLKLAVFSEGIFFSGVTIIDYAKVMNCLLALFLELLENFERRNVVTVLNRFEKVR